MATRGEIPPTAVGPSCKNANNGDAKTKAILGNQYRHHHPFLSVGAEEWLIGGVARLKKREEKASANNRWLFGGTMKGADAHKAMSLIRQENEKMKHSLMTRCNGEQQGNFQQQNGDDEGRPSTICGSNNRIGTGYVAGEASPPRSLAWQNTSPNVKLFWKQQSYYLSLLG